MFTNNQGYSFDWGFKVRFERLELIGSMVDVAGKINWKDHAKTYSTKGQFDFYGFSSLNLEKTSFTSIADSIKTELNVKTEKIGTYEQPLNTRVYAGANFLLTDNFRMGVALHIEDKPYGAEAGALAYVSTKLWDFWNIGVSAGTRNSGKQYDFGVQSSVSILNTVQLYFVTDNIVPYFSPTNARSINGRLGMNLMFGKDDNSSVIKKAAKDEKGAKTSKKKPKIKLPKVKRYWYKKKK